MGHGWRGRLRSWRWKRLRVLALKRCGLWAVGHSLWWGRVAEWFIKRGERLSRR